MKWIDAEKPAIPVLAYDTAKGSFFTAGIDLYFEQTEINKKLNRFVVYQFVNEKMMNADDPKNIKEIINAGNNYYTFDLQKIPVTQNSLCIAVSNLTNTNNESSLSNYIYLERRGNGWQMVKR